MIGSCLVDHFDRADNPTSLGVSSSGDTWTLQDTATYDSEFNPVSALGSILGIDTDQAYSSDTRVVGPHFETGYVNIGTVDTGFDDLDGHLDVTLPLPEAQGGGLVFRWSSATTYWIAFLYHQIGPGPYFLIVRKQTGGGASHDDPISVVVAPDGATGVRHLRVKTCRDRIQAWVDDVLVGAATDAFNMTATQHGICTYFSDVVRLDELRVCRSSCSEWQVGAVSDGDGWSVGET